MTDKFDEAARNAAVDIHRSACDSYTSEEEISSYIARHFAALRKENAELKKFVDSIGILHREREE